MLADPTVLTSIVVFPVGLQTESQDSHAIMCYSSIKVCTIVLVYLYCSMLFNLCHCGYLCVSITVCLLLAPTNDH
jgi:hypothetical protein